MMIMMIIIFIIIIIINIIIIIIFFIFIVIISVINIIVCTFILIKKWYRAFEKRVMACAEIMCFSVYKTMASTFFGVTNLVELSEKNF